MTTKPFFMSLIFENNFLCHWGQNIIFKLAVLRLFLHWFAQLLLFFVTWCPWGYFWQSFLTNSFDNFFTNHFTNFFMNFFTNFLTNVTTNFFDEFFDEVFWRTWLILKSYRQQPPWHGHDIWATVISTRTFHHGNISALVHFGSADFPASVDILT